MTAPRVDPLFLEFQNAIAGRYALDRELGRGGMGIVFLARDVALDRAVAIKLLPPGFASHQALRQRFLAEARTAARLSHPNIVPIFAVEEAERFVFFVMAYIPGATLGQRLRDRGPLPHPALIRLLREVAWALDYAHGMNVVHRDVKPDNILLEEGSGRALVADFGIAAGPKEGQGEGTSGTTGFMSPEQAAGAPLDGRSDLYALGVVGHLALSGRMPSPATPLAQIAPHAPRALAGTIDRCLRPERGHRFATGREIAEALDRAGSTELPAPIRMWLHRGQALKVPLALWTVMTAIPTLAVMLFVAQERSAVGPALMTAAMAALPWTGYAVWRLYQARRLLAAGYGLSDIQYALAVYSGQRAEELAFEYGKGPTPLGRALRKFTFASGIGCFVLLPLMAKFPDAEIFETGFAAAAYATLGGALLGMVVPGRDLREDRAVAWRLRVWRSALGRWMIGAAGWRLRPTGAPEQAVHRPTELALGHAADLLYEALPAASRQELDGLPETIALLTARAAELRQRVEELDGLRGDLQTRDAEARGALDEARTLWRGQFTETVGALESLRLGLLRLHNGAGAVASLATDLAHARTRMAALSRLLAAQADVERISPSTSPAAPAGPPSGRPSPGSSS
jgi:hypothetical protein